MSKAHALSHDENRLKVCLLCFWKKKDMFPLTKTLKSNFENLYENYVDDSNLPGALCCTCRRNLYRAKENEKRKLPDFSIFKRIETRSKSDLNCN